MSGMTSDRLEELRRIAEAATPGPWTSPWEQKDGLDPEEYGFYGASGEKIVGLFWYNGWHLECSEENARHISTFDPSTVLALLNELERLRREREALAEAFKHVLTCEDCECATCPRGTGLALRAYRALGGATKTLALLEGGDGA